MNITITHTGQWRYSEQALKSFEEFILKPLRKNNYEININAKYWIIKSNEEIGKEIDVYKNLLKKYCRNIKIEWINDDILNNGNNFDSIIHQDKNKYYRVFKMLELIKDDLEENKYGSELVLKTRSDLVYLNEIVVPKNIKGNFLYIPPIEGHEEIPYDPRTVCNDQVALGLLEPIKIYMSLSSMQSNYIKELEEKNTKKNKNLNGIEGILKEYLSANKIKIKNLELNYYIYGKPAQLFKIFTVKYMPRKIINMQQSKYKRMIFRVLRKIYNKLR